MHVLFEPAAGEGLAFRGDLNARPVRASLAGTQPIVACVHQPGCDGQGPADVCGSSEVEGWARMRFSLA
jgi:hypothetical protein